MLLIFLIALATALLQTKNVDYDGKFSIMANPIAKDISREYGLPVRKTASILDTFSCIMQGIIPYGDVTKIGQTLGDLYPRSFRIFDA